MIVHGMLRVNHDYAIAMNMLGFYMTTRYDYDLSMLHVTILIIFTWLS